MVLRLIWGGDGGENEGFDICWGQEREEGISGCGAWEAECSSTKNSLFCLHWNPRKIPNLTQGRGYGLGTLPPSGGILAAGQALKGEFSP